MCYDDDEDEDERHEFFIIDTFAPDDLDQTALFASFEVFFGNIAEVQWIDGEVPDKKTQEQIFIEAWNFLCLEERILEEELGDMDDDNFKI